MIWFMVAGGLFLCFLLLFCLVCWLVVGVWFGYSINSVDLFFIFILLFDCWFGLVRVLFAYGWACSVVCVCCVY